MNTKASVAYGWGVLILAGGGAYYFAKRSINADRAERALADERRRQAQHKMRLSEFNAPQTPKSSISKATKPKETGDDNPGPSREGAEGDPAPVSHVQQELAAKGKYEAAEPFRSRKGDRFSGV